MIVHWIARTGRKRVQGRWGMKRWKEEKKDKKKVTTATEEENKDTKNEQ